MSRLGRGGDGRRAPRRPRHGARHRLLDL